VHLFADIQEGLQATFNGEGNRTNGLSEIVVPKDRHEKCSLKIHNDSDI
jgi:hypothetical protein